MKLSEWLDEYRRLEPRSIERRVAESADDWEDPGLLAPADRVPDTSPRWRERAARVRYGRRPVIF
jgi:hypothetical protein